MRRKTEAPPAREREGPAGKQDPGRARAGEGADAGSWGSGIPRRRFLRWLVSTGVVGFVLPSPARAGYPETARAWRAMGTLIEVRVPDLPPRDAVEAVRRVRRRVESLEAAMTLFRPESPLVAFNASAPGRWTRVPADLARAVHAACDGFARSGGAFDPTVTPAMRAWGLYDLEGRMPSARFFRRWRDRPRADAVAPDTENRRLRRLDARVEVDLGAVGKGIAVDAALSELLSAGSRCALVNLGGSIGVLGPPPWDAEGWPVGLADPARPGAVCAELPLAEGHLATSGTYERWVDTAIGRTHHLLDPATGRPAPGIEAVTVRCARGLEADLQSTAEFVGRARSPEDAPVLFPRAVVMVSRSGRVAFTPDAALSPYPRPSGRRGG